MSEHETFLHVLRSPEPENAVEPAVWNLWPLATYVFAIVELALIGWALWHRLTAK
jgi:hypothetical protein